MFPRSVFPGILLCFFVVWCSGDKLDQERLLQRLLDNYNKLVEATNVTVKFGVALIRVGDFDEDNDIITLALYERWLWRDLRLTWEPSEFGGITVLRLPHGKIWKPDIKLYNSMSVEPSRDLDTNVVIYSTGDVLWIPKSLEKVPCFQIQQKEGITWSCDLKYGSWTYDGFQIALDLYEGMAAIDLSDYTERRNVKVVSTVGSMETLYYPCCAEPYPFLKYSLELSVNPSGSN